MDLGECVEVCEFCGASFWYEERLNAGHVHSGARYNGCCKGGKVVIDYPLNAPDLLIQLFLDYEFMGSIRAYNYMF